MRSSAEKPDQHMKIPQPRQLSELYSGAEEKNHLRSILNYTLWSGLGYLALIIGIHLYIGQASGSTLLIHGIAFLLFLGLRILLGRANITIVGSSAIILVFLWVLANNINQGTIRTAATATYLFVIILSGSLFGWRGILLSCFASSLAVMSLILAENAGLLPTPNYSVTMFQWVVYTCLFIITGSLSYYSYQVMHRSLIRADQEITERKRAEQELRALTRTVEQSPASIVITDLEGRIQYVNPRFSQVTGYSEAEVLGMNPRVLKSSQTPPETYRQLWETLAAGQEWRGEFVNRRKDGSLYFESATISAIKDENGVTTHYLAVKEDITERKLAEVALRTTNDELRISLQEIEHLQAELREQSLRDPMTGLYNRRFLAESLKHLIVQAERQHQPLSIIIADIDNFKQINDRFGHQVGDKYLVEIANLLVQNSRGSDIVCRYGGEEFLLLIYGATMDQAAQRSEEIRQKCAEISLTEAGQTFSGTLSFGIAAYPDHALDPEQVIIKADKALYLSKQAGRNRVTIWKQTSTPAP